MKLSKTRIKKIEKLYQQIEKETNHKILRKLEREFRNNYVPLTETSYTNDAYYVIPDKAIFPHKIKVKTVLDIFSGIGNLSYLVEAEKYILIDIDTQALETAKMLNKGKAADFIYLNKNAFSENFFEEIKNTNPDVITINPPFSKEFKPLTTDFIKKVRKNFPNSLILLVVPEKWQNDIDEEMTIVGESSFTGTSISTPIFVINNTLNLPAYLKQEEKTCEDEDIDLYQLYKEIEGLLNHLKRPVKEIEKIKKRKKEKKKNVNPYQKSIF